MASTTYMIYYTPSLALGTHKTTYTRDQINKAISRALGLLKANHQVGEGQFPHAFSKSPVDGTHAHVQGPFFTFPLLQGQGGSAGGSAPYNGEGSAGPDRVVFGSVNKEYTSAVFVAVAGVTDDTDALLQPFADTSVNHARATPQDFAAHEEAEGPALKPLVPTAEDNKEQALLTDDDVKIALA